MPSHLTRISLTLSHFPFLPFFHSLISPSSPALDNTVPSTDHDNCHTWGDRWSKLHKGSQLTLFKGKAHSFIRCKSYILDNVRFWSKLGRIYCWVFSSRICNPFFDKMFEYFTIVVCVHPLPEKSGFYYLDPWARVQVWIYRSKYDAHHSKIRIYKSKYDGRHATCEKHTWGTNYYELKRNVTLQGFESTLHCVRLYLYCSLASVASTTQHCPGHVLLVT